VPGQECAREVDVQGLLQVDGDEIVEQGLGARGYGLVEKTGLALEALNGGDVGLSVGLGEGSTVLFVSKEIPVTRKEAIPTTLFGPLGWPCCTCQPDDASCEA